MTARILARPDRVGVEPDIIRRTLDGRLRICSRWHRAPERPLSSGRTRGCWEARSGAGGLAVCANGPLGPSQTQLGKDALRTAMAVFRPDLYDAALGKATMPAAPKTPTSFAAFAGPAFDPEDIPGYLASFDLAKRA